MCLHVSIFSSHSGIIHWLIVLPKTNIAPIKHALATLLTKKRQRQRDEEDPLVLASCWNEVHFSGFLQEDLRVLGWGRTWGPTWATNQPCISNYHCQISLKEHWQDNRCNHLLVSFLIVSQVWSFGCSSNNKSWFREHQCHNRSRQKHLVMYVKHNFLYRDWRILKGWELVKSWSADLIQRWQMQVSCIFYVWLS